MSSNAATRLVPATPRLWPFCPATFLLHALSATMDTSTLSCVLFCLPQCTIMVPMMSRSRSSGKRRGADVKFALADLGVAACGKIKKNARQAATSRAKEDASKVLRHHERARLFINMVALDKALVQRFSTGDRAGARAYHGLLAK